MDIPLNEFNCRISISEKGFEALATLEKSYSSCVIIADDKLAGIYGQEVIKAATAIVNEPQLITFPPGETSKTISTASLLWEKLITIGADRSSLIISLGGGVTTDLAGFIASTFMRGVDIVHIPTSLLAMVDAAIGGKTGINLPQGKNLVGTIHHPRLVLINLELLTSLSQKEYQSGLAEVIKSAVLGSPSLFEFLTQSTQEINQRQPDVLKKLVVDTCIIKSEIVKQDEKEQNLRAVLNYGHTYAHAIETATNYTQYTHGEAVSIGMSCAAHAAKELGLIDLSFIQRQDSLSQQLGLPIILPDIDNSTLINLMKKDKKSLSGKINLIVPEKVGKVIKATNVATTIINNALKDKRKFDNV
jgi:3-dehydroquinate synthase